MLEFALHLTRHTDGFTWISQRPGGGYRLVAPVPADLDAVTHLAVLAALAGADRYGHRYTSTAQSIWAELD
ncbi:hypothetical protein GCM10009760_14620 [Kitasatospora kazusensis]|uniref:Transcriptional regulator n=2 Tax=Kitasatospora kazusensis TaxID=407974 RepID=A0ABN2Z2B8_9ACTN